MFLCSHASITGGKNKRWWADTWLLPACLVHLCYLLASQGDKLGSVTPALARESQGNDEMKHLFLISCGALKRSGASLNAIWLEDSGYLLGFSSLWCSWRRETSKDKKKLKTWPISLYRMDCAALSTAEVLLNGAKVHGLGCTQAGLSKPLPSGQAQVIMAVLQRASEEEEGGSA